LNRLPKNPLNNSWITIAARWILGLTFVYASYHKLLAPADFAKILYGYELFPNALINLIAIILPFIELVLGLALIFGIYTRAAAMAINGLLAAYIVILSINLVRGHVFECGCFSVKRSAYLSSPGPMIVRDIIYLAMGMLIFSRWGKRTILKENTHAQ
jgi:putative oxidoreductase